MGEGEGEVQEGTRRRSGKGMVEGSKERVVRGGVRKVRVGGGGGGDKCPESVYVTFPSCLAFRFTFSVLSLFGTENLLTEGGRC